MDKFVEYLSAELQGKTNDIEKIAWGEEIVQLPPSILMAIAPPYRGEVAPPLPQLVGTPVRIIFENYLYQTRTKISLQNFFFRPVYSKDLSDSAAHGAVSHQITLTAAQTQAFRANCKAHGFTVTPVVTTLSVLAEIETALTVGVRKGPEAFKEVHESFMNSDGFFIPVNAGNRVRLLPSVNFYC